jgi:DNA modification methylase
MVNIRNKTVMKDLNKLTEYSKNNKEHPKEQIDLLKQNILKFGFTTPFLISKDNVLIAGHGRKLACEQLGIKEVPCIVIDDLSEDEMKALRIADNRVGELGETNWLNVKEEWLELKESGLDFLTGYVEDDFLEMEEETGEVTEDDFEVPDELETDIKLGDVIQLGNHRLMCGDSTNEEMVLKLINEETITGVHTDPPYGINLDGDNSGRGAGTSLMKGGLKLKSFKDDTVDYAVQAFNIVSSLNIKKQVWWGANYYAHSIPQTGNWLVWDKRVEEKMENTNSDGEMAWILDGHNSVRIFRHLWNGLIKASEHGEKRVHPTQKPIALASWCFDKYDMGDNILDLFGGSGSTLMACEERNRNCFIMEFEPHYAEVICQRWEKQTGKTREVLND